MVGVLVLVHQHVLEALLIAPQHLGMLVEQAQRLAHQVVEVQRAPGAQHGLVGRPDARRRLLHERRGACGIPGGVNDLVLGPADHGVNRQRRVAPLVQPQVGHAVAYHLALVFLVVDRELRRDADRFAVGPKDTAAGGMEGAHPDSARSRAAQQRMNAIAHLMGGLVGEGDRQDAARSDAARPDQVGDAVRQHAGLARPGAGQHEQRAARMRNGLALRWVQGREQIHGPPSTISAAAGLCKRGWGLTGPGRAVRVWRQGLPD